MFHAVQLTCHKSISSLFSISIIKMMITMKYDDKRFFFSLENYCLIPSCNTIHCLNMILLKYKTCDKGNSSLLRMEHFISLAPCLCLMMCLYRNGISLPFFLEHDQSSTKIPSHRPCDLSLYTAQRV